MLIIFPPRDACLASHINMVRASKPSWTKHPSLALQHAVTPYTEADKKGMPLPIEENVHTPGSPIISPADLKEADLPRPTSVLSSATAEEDEYEEEYQPPGVGDVATVPTLIEWEGPGERVYVTGTFAGWNRKFRLHRK